MRRVVVELQVLVADVRYPIEMAEDAVGKAVSPGPHQQRPQHLEGEVGGDGAGEGDRRVQPHAELARDLDHAQVPRDEGAERAEGDPLPQPAFAQGREAEAVAEVRRCDVDPPDVPGRPDRGPPDDQQGPDQREERRRDAEEADIEGADPEVEQVSADERPTADAVLVLEIQHRHRWALLLSARQVQVFRVVVVVHAADENYLVRHLPHRVNKIAAAAASSAAG